MDLHGENTSYASTFAEVDARMKSLPENIRMQMHSGAFLPLAPEILFWNMTQQTSSSQP